MGSSASMQVPEVVYFKMGSEISSRKPASHGWVSNIQELFDGQVFYTYIQKGRGMYGRSANEFNLRLKRDYAGTLEDPFIVEAKPEYKHVDVNQQGEYAMVFMLIPGSRLFGIANDEIHLHLLFGGRKFYMHKADGSVVQHELVSWGGDSMKLKLEELRKEYGQLGSKEDPFVVEFEPRYEESRVEFEDQAIDKSHKYKKLSYLKVKYDMLAEDEDMQGDSDEDDEPKMYFKLHLRDDLLYVLSVDKVYLSSLFPGWFMYKKAGSGVRIEGCRKYSIQDLRQEFGHLGTKEDPFEVESDAEYQKLKILTIQSPEGKPITLEERGLRSYFDMKIHFTYTYEKGTNLCNVGEPILPELQVGKNVGKPTLVLDLDNTLVATKCAEGCYMCYKQHDYYVSKRHGVEEFLREMAELFELVLWTGSQKHYADAILDQVLDPRKEIFSYRLYNHDKDLARLGRDLKRVVMLDDEYSLSYINQKIWPNMIVIAAYYARHKENGGHLEKVSRVLRDLAASDKDVDFRVELERLRNEEGGVLDQIEEDGVSSAVVEEMRLERKKRKEEIRYSCWD